MRRYLLSGVLLLFSILSLSAQQGQDFASRFISLYGGTSNLSCRTVSPAMMSRVLQLPGWDDDSELQNFAEQVRTLRIVTATEKAPANEELFTKALTLARQNRRRYSPATETENNAVYCRKRGNKTIEIVAFRHRADGGFILTDFTGNFTDDTISRMFGKPASRETDIHH